MSFPERALALAGALLFLSACAGDDDGARPGPGLAPLPDPEDFGYAAAVTDDPVQEWVTTLPGQVAGQESFGAVEVVGDLAVVTDGNGTIHALDGSGTVLWSVPRPDLLVAPIEGSEVVLAVTGSGTAALSPADGSQLWSVDGVFPIEQTDTGLLVASESKAGVLDPQSGAELWSVTGEVLDLGVLDDVVVVADSQQVRALAVADGVERWAADGVVPALGQADIAVAQDFAVVGGAEVTAYDLSSGAELWTEPGGRDGTDVGLFSASEVSLVAQDNESDEPAPVRIHDRDGERGTLEDEDGSVQLAPFMSGGSAFALDRSSGAVYDDGYRLVEAYAGSLTLVDGGLYALREGELSYQVVGEAAPAWTAGVGDPAAGLDVGAFEGRFVVTDGTVVTSYR